MTDDETGSRWSDVRPEPDLIVHAEPAGDATALVRAQQAVRDQLMITPDARIEVLVPAGTYRLTEPLVFGPADGATGDGEVRWVGATPDGGEVIITGALDVPGPWTRQDGPIMRTRLDPGLRVDQLFVDRRRATLARYPNRVDGAPLDGGAADAIDPDRVAGWADPTTALVRGLHPHEWGGCSYRVTGIADGGSLALDWVGDNQRGSGLHPQHRLVENVIEELDTEDEWFYDRRTGWLAWWPEPGVDLDTARVELAGLAELIIVEGDGPDRPVTGLVFTGLTLTGTGRTLFDSTYEPLQLGDWSIVRKGALRLTHTRGLTLTDLVFDQVGGNAVMIDGYAERVVVEDCTCAGSGASDVAVVGRPDAVRDRSVWGQEVLELTDHEPGPRSESYPRAVIIRRNHLHHMGRFEKQSAGVQISMARAVTVEHNTIHHGPRAAINVNDGTWGGHRLVGNLITAMVQETGDHGPINAWGRDRYWPLTDVTDADRRELVDLDALEVTEIADNRIWHDRDWAIDLDDGSSRYLITGNLLVNAGVKLREGFHRTVTRNVFVNGGLHAHVSYADSDDVITHNLFLTRQPYFMIRADPAHSKIVYDHNWFWADGEPVDQITEAWRAHGHDQHSQTGDPGVLGESVWRRDTVQTVELADDAGPRALGLAARVAADAGAPGVDVRLPPVDWSRGAATEHHQEASVVVHGAALTTITSATVASSVGLYLGQSGLYVETVETGSLLADAGVAAGDVVLTVDDRPLERPEALADALDRPAEAAGPVRLGLWRDQHPLAVDVRPHAPDPS